MRCGVEQLARARGVVFVCGVGRLGVVCGYAESVYVFLCGVGAERGCGERCDAQGESDDFTQPSRHP